MVLQTTSQESLKIQLKALKLPGFLEFYEEMAIRAEKGGWTYGHYLSDLVEQELADRKQRRTVRLLKQSGLPMGKTLATLDLKHLPPKVVKQLPTLCEGNFASKAINVLVFGLPGRGKTHLVSAIGSELIHRGFRVFFTMTYQLVQRLLAAKRDLRLERELKKLDKFDVVILDDIGYVQQDRDEMEVLFTFLAERYERRSVMITSNLVFSQWDRIFKDPMTTAAAIDRLVHHSLIIELTGASVREEEARTRKENSCSGRSKRNSKRKEG